MDIVGTASLVLTILILIGNWVRRKFFLRPELTIQIKFDGGKTNPIGLSSNNDFSSGSVDGREALRIFRVTWNFNVTITNNSDHTAYYPEFEFNPLGPRFTKLDDLDKYKPIKPGDSVTLKAEHSYFEEKKGEERTHPNSKASPDHMNSLEILLEYQNGSKQKFRTLYKYELDEGKNLFLTMRPKDYRKNN